MACPAPRATPADAHVTWPTWSAPTATSCARSPATAPQAEAVKVVTRAHKTLIWERTRHMLRLRQALREFFPAALAAFDDLTAPTRWNCWPRRPTRPRRPR